MYDQKVREFLKFIDDETIHKRTLVTSYVGDETFEVRRFGIRWQLKKALNDPQHVSLASILTTSEKQRLKQKRPAKPESTTAQPPPAKRMRLEKYEKQQKRNELIKAGLQKHMGENWSEYLGTFMNAEVYDADLKFLSNEDLKELIPKIGPRNRFKAWMKTELSL